MNRGGTTAKSSSTRSPSAVRSSGRTARTSAIRRDPVSHSSVGRFWSNSPHYFGYRVVSLPPRYRLVRYYGLDYYFWDDVFYRPLLGGGFYVCRPPIGYVLSNPITDLAFAAVTFAYYNSLYNSYSASWGNYGYTDSQNRVVASKNAEIAAQYGDESINTVGAAEATAIAQELGLTQRYALADEEYFYDDGVFYVQNNQGLYEVIVPPAGALVEELPDDYDYFEYGDTFLYQVDDTVYRIVDLDGTLYFEVLGQKYE